MAGLARKRDLHKASRCCCMAQAPVTCFIKARLLLSACSKGAMVTLHKTSGTQEYVTIEARHVAIRVDSSGSVTSCVSGTPARAAGLRCRTPGELWLVPSLHLQACPGSPPQRPHPQRTSTERPTSAGQQPLQQRNCIWPCMERPPPRGAPHLKGTVWPASTL